MIESFCDFVILYVKDFAIIFLSLSRTVSNYHNKCKYCYDLQTTIMNQNKLPLTISITIKLSLSQSHKYQQYHRIAICHAWHDGMACHPYDHAAHAFGRHRCPVILLYRIAWCDTVYALRIALYASRRQRAFKRWKNWLPEFLRNLVQFFFIF